MRRIYLFSVQLTIGIVLLGSSFKKLNAQNLSLQSSLNVTDVVSGSGNAGIVFTGTEYWLSKWFSDSIATLTPSGSVIDRFVVPGVTGIRAMTWDGSFIYAAVDTRTIYKINPVTKTQVGTITAPNVTRLLSYTSAANGGAGGLWIGDDFGDLRLISLTGTILQTIPEATHGLGAMWGSGFDSVTTNGGPYLWIFDRGTSGSGANLVRIPVSTGVPQYTYNVVNDFPSAGVAAGAYLSYSLTPGQPTLVAILQSVPNILASYRIVSTLPVTLVSFSGEKRGVINSLNWKTATEQNSKGFELQRSADGNQFTTIATINSKAMNGNSALELSYSFDDIQPLKGNNYYRLKQIDKNGRSTNSNTIVLKGAAVTKAEINNLYPNPVSSTINVSINTPADSKISFTVTDMKGNLLISQTTQAKAGSNNFALNAASLTTGSYILKAIDNAGQPIGEIKFLKQ